MGWCQLLLYFCFIDKHTCVDTKTWVQIANITVLPHKPVWVHFFFSTNNMDRHARNKCYKKKCVEFCVHVVAYLYNKYAYLSSTLILEQKSEHNTHNTHTTKHLHIDGTKHNKFSITNKVSANFQRGR